MADWTPCAQFAKGWQDATVPDDECSRYLRSVGFDPLPKQYDFITCEIADDLLYGGSRGGAKTQAIMGDWLWHDKQHGENAKGIVFRRERTQLVDFIERCRRILTKDRGFTWHPGDKYFSSERGSLLRFAYLDNDNDAEKYQGHEYTRVYIEERGTFPREAPLNKLLATVRSGVGVRGQMKSTCNPGGPGHLHIRERYNLVDKIPAGYKTLEFFFEHPITGERLRKTRMFIPSKLQDNKYLGNDYVGQLHEACAGNAALLEAWLTGRWDVVDGAFFNSWSGQHVIPPFDIPNDWLRFRSIRWGSARPLSVGWWAVAGTDCTIDGADIAAHATSVHRHDERPALGMASSKSSDRMELDQRNEFVVPKGSLVRYREWYAQKSAGSNEGLKLTAEQIAEGIRERTPQGERIFYTVASPQIWDTDGGPSLAERFARAGLPCIPGDDKSSKELGHAGGWDELRARLVGRDGVPAIFCFTNCPDSVRTIPALQHDRDEPEEIDHESETAAADDWRFACMSRPWNTAVPEKPKPKIITVGGTTTVTMNDLWAAREKRISRRF